MYNIYYLLVMQTYFIIVYISAKIYGWVAFGILPVFWFVYFPSAGAIVACGCGDLVEVL